ncbi:MAG: fatty acid oxidation complex subunit alpha FadB [Proteobacteria bacterium]|nr:fatty acid oxidation complex subunit alpha FadB [Pseudomonadota bacterium]
MQWSGVNLSVDIKANSIAELKFDAQNSSVNKFDQATVQEFRKALQLLAKSEKLRGLVLTSGKSAFIVGADITEFGVTFAQGANAVAEFAQYQLESFNLLEDLPFPTVVAINGFALGGGLEVSLACDFRVLSEQALIGLPETQLGIIPGWGGTVRLPRIAGLETAVDWICSGKHQNSATALEAGVADAVVSNHVSNDALWATATSYIEQCHAGKLDYQSKSNSKLQALDASEEQITQGRSLARSNVLKGRGAFYPALAAAIDAIFEGANKSRDEALAIETKHFAAVATTDEAVAMVGNFVADQALTRKARNWAKRASKANEKLAVLGAGIMGGGIAYSAALKGTPVIMKDINQAGIDLGLSEADKLLSKRVKRGQMTAETKANILENINGQLDYDGFKSADIVVEAVIENPKVKQLVLAEVEQALGDNAIIASNTSTISISYLAEALKQPGNFCGMHFFNPVHAMPLVEVIRGEKTSDEAIARTVALANAMGKKAVVVNDCPGFLVNRVLFPYYAGFAGLLSEGVNFVRIDKVMEAWGWPMGPAYLADIIGIDTMAHCEIVMAEGFPNRMAKPEQSPMDLLLQANRLGQKNAEGFYIFEKDQRGRLQKQYNDAVEAVLAPCRHTHTELMDEDIVARMMIPMVTEMARCLEEGIIDSPAEADLSLLYGLGFPNFRGGVMRWVDTVGINNIIAMTEKWQHLGELYEPTEGMRALAHSSDGYY